MALGNHRSPAIGGDGDSRTPGNCRLDDIDARRGFVVHGQRVCAQPIAGRRVGTNQHTQGPPLFEIPQPHRSIHGQRHRAIAGRRHRDSGDAIPMSLQHVKGAPGIEVPDPQCSIPRRGQRAATIGGQPQGLDRFRVPVEHPLEPVCCRVPDLGRRAGERRSRGLGRRHHAAAVSGDGEEYHRASFDRYVGSMMRRCHVPAAHGAIPGRRKDARPGGRHGHGSH